MPTDFTAPYDNVSGDGPAYSDSLLDPTIFTGKPGAITAVQIAESEPELERINGKLCIVVVARGGILVPMTPVRWLVYSFARTCLHLSAKNSFVLSGW